VSDYSILDYENMKHMDSEIIIMLIGDKTEDNRNKMLKNPRNVL
jgi:hypothetical protein